MRTKLLALAAPWLIALACSAPPAPPLPPDARADLREAETFEILALDPVGIDMRGLDPATTEHLHGYRVLSRATIEDAATRRRIVDLVERGIEDSDGSVAACFDPRHGVRAARAGHTTELVICFECLSLHVHRDGARAASATTASSPAPELNAIWAAHGCPVAKKD